MGRLTLNVLLSFAQFEREVTGERIRDKIAASKRKGMFMGGPVALGYSVQDRKLVVVPEEAARVNEIFRSYLQTGCVRLLQRSLHSRNIRSKARVNKAGTPYGNQRFARGALAALLRNPIYIGEIRHKGVRHPGQHEGIVDRSLWDAVQAQLDGQAVRAGIPNRKTESSVLMGKLFDDLGQRLSPSHALKQGRRYRYYVSQRLITDGESNSGAIGWRLPAREIERAIIQCVVGLLNDRAAIVKSAQAGGLSSRSLSPLLSQATRLRETLESNPSQLAAILDRAIVKPDGIEVSVALSSDQDSEAQLLVSRFVPIRMKKRGVEMRMVIDAPGQSAGPVDRTLLRALARGRAWFDQLVSGKASSMAAIAKKAGVIEQWVHRGIRLAFVSPEIVELALAGRQAPDLTAESLLRADRLELDWSDQKQALESG